MDKKLFKQYKQLNNKIADLENQKKELRDSILNELKKEDVEKAETTYGTFTISVRRSYSYSDDVKKLEEKIKIAKVKEEQKGVAKEKQTEYLVFTQPK